MENPTTSSASETAARSPRAPVPDSVPTWSVALVPALWMLFTVATLASWINALLPVPWWLTDPVCLAAGVAALPRLTAWFRQQPWRASPRRSWPFAAAIGVAGSLHHIPSLSSVILLPLIIVGLLLGITALVLYGINSEREV